VQWPGHPTAFRYTAGGGGGPLAAVTKTATTVGRSLAGSLVIVLGGERQSM